MSKPNSKSKDRKIIATNRRAYARYSIVESVEAGIVLTGPEVKSLRAGGVNLQEGFARVDNEEVFLWNVHIAPYSQGSLHVEQVPTRTRKLLLNKNEIKRFIGKAQIKGYSLLPLEIYFNRRGIAKVRLGLGKGKKTIDRRDEIKRRTINREMQRAFAGRQKIK